MPDFSHQAVHKFWNEYQDSSIYRVIAFMESVEDWTLDGNNELETALKKLGETFENINKLDLEETSAIIELIANISTGRGLSILMHLDMALPGTASKILQYAQEHPESSDHAAKFLMQRNVIFERLRLLYRIFSPKRLKLITDVLEEPI